MNYNGQQLGPGSFRGIDGREAPIGIQPRTFERLLAADQAVAGVPPADGTSARWGAGEALYGRPWSR